MKPSSNREELTSALLEEARVLVIATPQDVFTDSELAVLKKYVASGGAVLVTLTDGGEENNNTNINFFLEEYGVVINNGQLKFFNNLIWSYIYVCLFNIHIM